MSKLKQKLLFETKWPRPTKSFTLIYLLENKQKDVNFFNFFHQRSEDPAQVLIVFRFQMSNVPTNNFASNPDQVLSGSTSSNVQPFHLGQVEPGDFVTIPMIHHGEAQTNSDQVNNQFLK